MQDYLYQKMHEVETTHWWFQAKKEIIIQLIRNKIISQFGDSIIDIADIGCGVGLLLNSLTEFGKVTGIDYSKLALDFCQQSFSGELIQADFGKSITVNKQFDLVIASDFIEHIKDDKIAINNIYNLLKPNGYAIITVPAFQFLWSKHDENNMHYRRYDLKSLKQSISSACLNIDYISYYNFFLFHPAFVVRMIKKVFNIDKKSNLELSVPINFINNTLYNIFYSESKFINKGRKFPYGLSLIAVVQKSKIG